MEIDLNQHDGPRVVSPDRGTVVNVPRGNSFSMIRVHGAYCGVCGEKIVEVHAPIIDLTEAYFDHYRDEHPEMVSDRD